MTEKDVTTTPPDSAAPDGADPTELQQERDDLYDRLLRVTAEFDNYRKRTDRERRLLSESAGADVIQDLLPVLDDLERALDAATEADDAFREGVQLIHRQLLEVLRRRGVEPIESVGQLFDPNWHEALAQEPADGHADGEVVGEVRRGYRIGERLLRAAMVRVAKA